MGAQNGKDLLIKIDMAGTGMFETVAGLRASRIAFNAEAVDATSISSPGGWREILRGAGVKTASVSGSGVFRDADTDARMRESFFNGETGKFQVVVPDFGIIEGPFLISDLEYSGNYNGEAAFRMTLESAGALSFAPL